MCPKVRTVADLERFRPVPPGTDQAAIIREILSKLWAYAPNEYLPPLETLAEELQVPIDRVEEALLLSPQIHDFLIVEHDWNSMTRLRVRPSAPLLVGPIDALPPEEQEQLHKEQPQLLAILRARVEIESVTAGLAAKNRDIHHVQILGEALEHMGATSCRLRRVARRLADDHEQIPYVRDEAVNAQGARAAWALKRADWIFHLTIAAAAGELDLYQQVDQLRHAFFAPFASRWYRWLRQQESYGEHYEIQMAIHDGNEEGAAAAMARHLKGTAKSLSDWLQIGRSIPT
jgi:DNA-binding FadR family transcriptional regulator